MKLSMEEKIDLYCCVIHSFNKEIERYGIVKDMTEEEIQGLRIEHDIMIELDKKTMENDINRLRELKARLKEELNKHNK